MILRDVMIPGKELQCDACQFVWVSIAKELPDFCPNRECRTREWNGKKKRSSARIRLPKPTKIRHEDEEMDF